ncbi:MAG TPA: hypothetical protein VIK84_07755 [Haloplasmataceae bacterium]
MIDKKMKSMIIDIDLLIYIHDVIFLRDSSVDEFPYTKIYKEIYESDFITIIKYLKYACIKIIAFLLTIYVFRNGYYYTNTAKYLVMVIIAIIFGVLFVRVKDNLIYLSYQLRAKKAVQFALEHYHYPEFLYFLDNYMSEQSTKNYFKKKNK